MKTIALFNHKGGVGKTTLTVNLADAFAALGKRVLLLDSDPQCNLSSFYLEEKFLDELFGDGEDDDGTANTLWKALRPVAYGRGDVDDTEVYEVGDNLFLAVGDVLLSRYEEELPLAWTESFARKTRGYDVMCAMSRLARKLGAKVNADIIMYDIGPNVGPLNRAILLDCDFFVTPVHTDLYSLRALTTVGHSLSQWIVDWRTIRTLAGKSELPRLLSGKPVYLGYLSSAFKVYGGRKAMAHDYWERKIAPRVLSRVINVLKTVDEKLVYGPPYKLGDIEDFASLPAISQERGLPLSQLTASMAGGGNQANRAHEAGQQFLSVATELLRRMEEHG